ncbi:hypothetical protein AVEN_83055-1 [Araneus ventricosus]|uniref:Uncharacterized protein n=1 Tax=Araneus ventricosus TaxID=182803 RepID=A0A4Y2AMJ7_ARAVE|nr:hypothetical protein AVEN_83055-1 [Araneus ventricosus]
MLHRRAPRVHEYELLPDKYAGTRFPCGYSNGRALGLSNSDNTYFLREGSGRGPMMGYCDSGLSTRAIAETVIQSPWLSRQGRAITSTLAIARAFSPSRLFLCCTVGESGVKPGTLDSSAIIFPILQADTELQSTSQEKGAAIVTCCSC